MYGWSALGLPGRGRRVGRPPTRSADSDPLALEPVRLPERPDALDVHRDRVAGPDLGHRPEVGLALDRQQGREVCEVLLEAGRRDDLEQAGLLVARVPAKVRAPGEGRASDRDEASDRSGDGRAPRGGRPGSDDDRGDRAQGRCPAAHRLQELPGRIRAVRGVPAPLSVRTPRPIPSRPSASPTPASASRSCCASSTAGTDATSASLRTSGVTASWCRPSTRCLRTPVTPRRPSSPGRSRPASETVGGRPGARFALPFRSRSTSGPGGDSRGRVSTTHRQHA